MDRVSSTSPTLSTRLGSPTPLSLVAGRKPHTRDGGLGMGAFWLVLAVVTGSALTLYCWPAYERIARHEAALTEAEEKLERVRGMHAGLELELDALDDPFTVEWILRREHNWQPKGTER